MPATKSPLRYPGGKSQLTQFVRENLKLNNISGTYIEPFAGGAGIAIDLLLSGDVKRIVINDYDPSIHAIWHSILNNTQELINLIESVPFDYKHGHDLSADELMAFWDDQKVQRALTADDPTSLENAFSSLMLNRMNVSGVINGGPIGGRKQAGKYQIDARFNKATLIKKIMSIAERSSDIDLYNEDANDLVRIIKDNSAYDPDDTFIFFDPPYYEQGKNLYLSFIDKDQHEKLAKNILSMDQYHWITTYDHVKPIHELYIGADKLYEYSLKYSANRRGDFSEYMFAGPMTTLQFTEKMQINQLP